MTVLDTVKGLIAAHGANAVGAFTVADIQAMAEYIEASEALKSTQSATPPEWRELWDRFKQSRIRLGLAEKEAGRG